MTDPRIELANMLQRQLTETMVARDLAWADYWLNQGEGRRMVTVPDPSVKEGDAHHVVSEYERGCSGPADLTRPGDEPGRRLFASFPNLAPKDGPIAGTSFLDTPEHRTDMIARDKEISRTVDAMIAKRNVMWEPTVRDCIARLKAARAKESTNRNLSTLLAVVVKVQKDLETLVGDDWQKTDAAVESQVTRDDHGTA